MQTLASPRLAWCFFLRLCFLVWPGFVEPYHFPDSAEYLVWPEAVRLSDAVSSLGPRMPTYPLLPRLLGTGAPLAFALLRPDNGPLAPFLAMPLVSSFHDLRRWKKARPTR